MAAALIAITGTGSVLIKYDYNSNPHAVTAYGSDNIYIDDTSTNVTFTTTSGTAVASSEALTITELTQSCYLFQWEYPYSSEFNSLLFVGINTSSEEVSYDSINYTINNTWEVLAKTITNLNNVDIIPFSGKVEDLGNGRGLYSIIIKIITSTDPYLVISNTTTDTFLYLKGTVSDCLPEGFIEFNNCIESNL